MSVSFPLNQSDLVQFAQLLDHIRAKNPNLNLSELADSMGIEQNDVVGMFATAKAVCDRAAKSTCANVPTVLVKHWGEYQNASPMTHKVQIEDELAQAGRIGVYIEPIDSTDGSTLWATMEVSHDPHGHGSAAAVAHFAIDGEDYAFTLFQLNGEVLLVPEEGVEVESRPTGRGQTAYRIAWKC